MAGVFGEISAGVDLHVGIEGFSLPPVAPAKTWAWQVPAARRALDGKGMRQPTAQVSRGQPGERAHGAVPVSVQGQRESGCVGGCVGGFFSGSNEHGGRGRGNGSGSAEEPQSQPQSQPQSFNGGCATDVKPPSPTRVTPT